MIYASTAIDTSKPDMAVRSCPYRHKCDERETRCVRSSMLCHGGRDRADNCGDREAQWLETTDVAMEKGAAMRILDF